MLLDNLKSFVRDDVAPHLQGLFTTDGETQLMFANKENNIRIPKDGNGKPRFDDTAYHAPLDTLTAIGVSGWNYVDGRSKFITIDLDGIDHAAGHDAETLDDLVARLSRLPEVEIIKSKGGKGFHARVYFDADRQPFAQTREAHTAVGQRVLGWLANRIGLDLQDKADACGVIAWIWHIDRKEGGFDVVKPSTAFIPEGWEIELPPDVRTGECEIAEPAMPVTAKHQTIIDTVTSRGLGEWKDGRLTTHTFHLLTIAEELKIDFATIATGKDGKGDRNCFMYPASNGAWKVIRFGKNAKEHESWWTSSNGYTMTWFNKGKEGKVDVATALTNIAKDDELFHDSAGQTYATATIRGVRETVPISSDLYKAKLRLTYTGKTGQTASDNHLKTAIAQLKAIALLERPEFQVANRIAEHGGKLYIDLANQKRQVVEVGPDSWRIVDDAPVRFLRPFGVLPLPEPLAGGSLKELRQFINVDDSDLPLLMAFVVGCFHPSGPYSLLQVVGEQGSAKSSLMRLIHDLVDPQLAVGNTLPKDERDLLVAAQQRWLVSFDNVDSLNRKLSSLLCMLVTGAASANRKLFTDADQSILRAKRPIIVTAIANVVTASDLLDRTLTLVLPPIPSESRKSEFAIAQELRRDGVRGRILGFILNGVSAALKGHASVKRNDMPRLADLFSWATAAEPALEIEPGSAIEAVKRQSEDESSQVVESPFGRKIAKLCKEGWKGTAKELSAQLECGLSPKDISNQLREIAPDLRRTGHRVEFRKSSGDRIIDLSTSA